MFQKFIGKMYKNNEIEFAYPKRSEKEKEAKELLQFDYFACFPEKINGKLFSNYLTHEAVRVRSNPNNFLFFLKFFKYFQMDFDRITDEFVSKVEPLFKHLYRVLIDLRLNLSNFEKAEEDWILNLENLLEASKNDANEAEFLVAINALSKTALNRRVEIPRIFGEIEKDQWLSKLLVDAEFTYDFQQLTSLNLVITEDYAVTFEEKKALSTDSAHAIMRNKLDNGKLVLNMKEIDPEFDSNFDVFVVLLEEGDYFPAEQIEEVLKL